MTKTAIHIYVYSIAFLRKTNCRIAQEFGVQIPLRLNSWTCVCKQTYCGYRSFHRSVKSN